MESKKLKFAAALVFLLALSACSLPWQKKAITPQTKSEAAETQDSQYSYGLKQFANESELRLFLATHNQSPVQSEAKSPEVELNIISSREGEGDIIKADGTYIYALSGRELFITKAQPANEASLVARLSFSQEPKMIFLSNGKLAVIGEDRNLAQDKGYALANVFTSAKVYDVSDPARPRLDADLAFEGSLRSAELEGGRLHVLTLSSGYGSEALWPRRLAQGNEMSADMPSVYYFDIPYGALSYLSANTLDLGSRSELARQDFVLTPGQLHYLAGSNLYISYQKTISSNDLRQTAMRELVYPLLPDTEKKKVDKIEAAASYLLSSGEKSAKVVAVLEQYRAGLPAADAAGLEAQIEASAKQKLSALSSQLEKSYIYKLSFSGSDLQYRGQGEVSGLILDGAINDDGADLRVLTGRGSLWSSLVEGGKQESYTSLFVLDDSLKTVGKLENLATSERIRTASFVGSRAYLISGRRSDPIYVVGLTDKTKPEVLGALQVPGDPSFLKAVDKNGLFLSLGKDVSASPSGDMITKGIKLSLFDFSDLTKPKEVESFVLGQAGSESVALGDPKALALISDKNILSLPAVIYEEGRLSFAGSFVFSLSGSSLSLKGRAQQLSPVMRSLFVGNDLYTFSGRELLASEINELKALRSVRLTEGRDDYIISPAAVQPQAATTSEPTMASTSPIL